MSPDAVARRTRWLVRVSVTLVAVTLLVTGGLLYGAFGWHRMDAACNLDENAPPMATESSVEMEWSWDPLGFSCTWPGAGPDGVTITKLWW